MASQRVTTNQANMNKASQELENIHATLNGDIVKMRDLVQSCKTVWTDDAINEYIKSYEKKEPDLQAMAKVIGDCALALREISQDYAKADLEALDAIKSTMGGR